MKDNNYRVIVILFRIYFHKFSQRDNEAKNADDVLFDMFRNETTDLLPIGKFLAALRTSGIRMNDLRIKEMMENLRKVHRLSNSEGGTPETQKLNRETFKSYVIFSELNKFEISTSALSSFQCYFTKHCAYIER